jgi:hypothetical protein
MTEFTKTKIHFALALLGTLFALHPFLQRFENYGFMYLGYELQVSYAYVLIAGFLALCVYCYGLTLVTERPHSWLEKLGNYSYGLAVIVLPLYGALFLSSLLADRMGQSHLAWAAPTVAAGLGIAWLVLSQLLVWLLRRRLGAQDRSAKIEQLEKQEMASLLHAGEFLANEHWDLSVIESWRAVEARLRRVLLSRGRSMPKAGADALIHTAKRWSLVREPALGLLHELKHQWDIAISTEPITKEAAVAAQSAARHILATISLPDLGGSSKPNK